MVIYLNENIYMTLETHLVPQWRLFNTEVQIDRHIHSHPSSSKEHDHLNIMLPSDQIALTHAAVC